MLQRSKRSGQRPVGRLMPAAPAVLVICALGLSAVGALAAGAFAAGRSAHGASPRVAVGTRPVSEPDATIGALAPGTHLHLTVVLRPHDAAALAARAAAVSSPSSPLYRRFLDVDQFAARFGASATDVKRLRATLRREGLHPGSLARDHLSLTLTGSAAAVSRTFEVTLRRYRERSGRVVFANDRAPSVPRALGGIVVSVLGLSDTQAAVPEGLREITSGPTASAAAKALVAGSPARRAAPRQQAHAASFAGPGAPQPCAAAASFAASKAGSVNTISQIGNAYRFGGLYADGDYGQGVTVALLELEPYSSEASDVAAFEACYGISASVTDVAVDGGSPLTISTAESAVDIQNLLGLAPDVKVVVYYGPNSGDGQYDTLASIVDAAPSQHAQVISNSWGLCEQNSTASTLEAESSLLEEATIQGQTFLSSSGDRGAEGCAPQWNNNLTTQTVPTGSAPASDLAVDDPASQPYATAVGGTTLNAVGPPPSEAAWEQLYWGASGGGISTFWQMPSYQVYSGAPGVLSSYSSNAPCAAPAGDYCREVPDVSADGSTQSGYATYYQGQWAGFGGTSTSAPDWAALVALTDSAAMGDSDVAPCTPTQGNAAPLGFLNPLLYQVAAGDHHTHAFNDVTAGGNNSGYFTAAGAPYGDYPVTVGYDMVTGLGTPIATDGSSPGLVSQLCTAAVTSTGSPAIVSALSSGEGAPGSTVTITGSGFTPFAAVWFGSFPATQVTDDSATQITATVPPGGGADLDVTVIKLSGVSQTNVDDRFTYAPSETISTPASGATYTQGQSLTASYSCTASTPGTPSCAGTVADGSPVDTSTVGPHQFSVSATDANAVTTTATSTYTVVAPPAIAISGVNDGATYSQGQAISAQVTCTTSAPITIASCSAPSKIDTAAPGTYTYQAVATDSNGVRSTRTVTYEVVAPPQVTITAPANGAYLLLGEHVIASYNCKPVAPATIVSCTGPLPTGSRVSTTKLGSHHFAVTATDSAGATATTTSTYTVVATHAKITALRQTATTWTETAQGGRHLPVGTTFTFALDQPARVRFTFSRSESGRVKGQRCVPASQAGAHAAHCTFSAHAGTLTVTAAPGANSITFAGRTTAGTLVPGTYTVVVQATGLSGRPSTTVEALFTIAGKTRG